MSRASSKAPRSRPKRAQTAPATSPAPRWWRILRPLPFRSLRRDFWRITLIAIGLYMVCLPFYHVIDSAVTHGVHRSGDTYFVDLRAMSDFEMDPVYGRTEEIPKPFRNLDGKRVMLTGQMWSPLGAAGKIRGFDLVYSINNCCFMGPPKVQHFVHATVPPARTVDFIGGQVIVTGKLHVGVEKSAGAVQSIYRLDVEQVQPN